MAYRDLEKRREVGRRCGNRYYKKHRDAVLKKQKVRYAQNLFRNWASHSLVHHKESGFIIRISTRELEELAKASTFCPICDAPLLWGKNKVGSRSPTLDRKNNENFLFLDNVWIICNLCNRTKSNRTFKEFIEYCEKITNKFKDRC